MAHTKAKGTSKLGRDSRSQRLGVKVFGGQTVRPGRVLVRQRGTRFFPGEGVKKGGDDSLFAVREGKVKFLEKKHPKFTGQLKRTRIVEVV